jgi:acyl-CoA reductase-like NAD-dependent aldehyde dehydrogenase
MTLTQDSTGAQPAAIRLTSEMIPVENPATGEIVGHVPAMTASEVAERARRATAVARAWLPGTGGDPAAHADVDR